MKFEFRTPSNQGLFLMLILFAITNILYLAYMAHIFQDTFSVLQHVYRIPADNRRGERGERGDKVTESSKWQERHLTSPANTNDKVDTKRIYQVYWHSPLFFLKFRPNILYTTNFSTCQFSNCIMTFSNDSATSSDAVLFDGHHVQQRPDFERPVGQIWVYAADESPWALKANGYWWKQEPWRNAFNWTMAYDRTNSDIYLPYGEIQHRNSVQKRNFTEIGLKKTKGGLFISSHCHTPGLREEYVKKLENFIPIKLLGGCYRHWDCGRLYTHDECFILLNTSYKFFLAFENAFCRQYFTEKFYENFDYDTIMIVRGGIPGSARDFLPKGAYIDTDSFRSVEELGQYLQHLSSTPKEYAALLAEKSRYYSIGYGAVYQRALCDLCERLNKQTEYHQEILDIERWADKGEPCRNPSDLN